MTSGILALDLRLQGTHLIEASAGTGKTWTIAGLYLRLIAEARRNVGEILVVTFTRRATQELKDRLRARLALAADIADEIATARDTMRVEDDDSAFARKVLGTAVANGEAIAALALRLRLAALGMDEAAILTIDGYCRRALREHALPSGQLFEAGEVIDSDRDLLEQVAADFWRLNASEPARAGDFDVLMATIGSPEKLAEVLQQLSPAGLAVQPEPTSRADAAALAETAARRQVTLQKLREIWQQRGTDDLAQIRKHAAAGYLSATTHRLDKVEAWIAACRDAFDAGTIPPSDSLKKLSLTGLREKTKKGNPLPPDLALSAAIDAWIAADDALNAAQRQRWPALLHEALAWARDQLAMRKSRLARQSHADVIERLHAAILEPVRGPALAKALHARHPAILVDEFQDTDARQFAIFRALAAAGSGTLVLVGDPKQAIYGFRGGDVHAYLEAVSEVEEVRRLERNFRSTPGLLRAVAALFDGAGTRAFVEDGIAFQPIAAGGPHQDDDFTLDGRPAAPLTIWHVPLLADDEEAPSDKSEATERLAEACAQAIVDLLRKACENKAILRDKARKTGPVQPKHIAVLVDTNRQAGIVQSALLKRGIGAATIRRDSIFASDEAREVLILLRGLDERDDRRLRAALATRLFGVDAATLAALADPAQPAAWHAEVQRFDALRETWQARGVLAMLERILESRAAALLARDEGGRRLANYLQLADLAQQASVHVFGLCGLVDWLEARIRFADDRNDEEQLRLESDADLVQVATIHASKGLEYDLVFLPFAPLRPWASQIYPRVLTWHSGNRRIASVATRADAPAKTTRATPGKIGATIKTEPADPDEIARRAAAREALAERVRCFYVAITRARYACWIAWGIVGKKGELPALAHLLHGGVPADDDAIRARLDALADSAAGAIRIEPLPKTGAGRLRDPDPTPLPPPLRFACVIDTSWWIHSFSQLRDGRRVELADTAGADDETRSDGIPPDATETRPASPGDARISGPAIPDWPRGERFGIAVHEILERADFAAWAAQEGAAPPPAERERVLMQVRRHALADTAREEEAARVIARFVGATLNTRLSCGVRLSDLPPAARRAELPFHFAIGGASPADFIALLQRHGHQRQRADFARLHGRLAGLMTGVIDLVFAHAGRYWLIDYKTNWLGGDRADYAPDALTTAVRAEDYDLQYLIYTLALHRWLRQRRGGDYDYDRDFGGVYYLFVRGLERDAATGIHAARPGRALIEDLDALLAPRQERAHG